MNQIIFESAKEIAHFVSKKYKNGKDVIVFAMFDQASAIMRELLKDDSINIGILEIENADMYDYIEEYAIELFHGVGLSVERAWAEENEYHPAGFYRFEADTVLYSGDVPQSLTAYCTATESSWFEINEHADGIKEHFDDEEDFSDEASDVVDYIGAINKCFKDSFSYFAKQLNSTLNM